MNPSRKLIPPTRIVRDYLSNSLVWSDFLTRDGFTAGDIVVADPFKAGTTWTQRIVQQILENGEETEASLSDTSPWLDSSWGDHARILALLQEQRRSGQRRVMKSHVHADALPIAPQARYIFVGRNGKDLGLSLHNYLRSFTSETMGAIHRIHAQWSGDPTPLVIPEDAQEFFDRWVDTNGMGCCDLLAIVKSWWELRNEPNVLLVHYAQLKRDLRGQVARMASFLDVDPAALRVDRIVQHSSFEYMRENAVKMAPFNGAHMSSAQSFFHKGPARDFHSELTPRQIDAFDRLAHDVLGRECAEWLESGEIR